MAKGRKTGGRLFSPNWVLEHEDYLEILVFPDKGVIIDKDDIWVTKIFRWCIDPAGYVVAPDRRLIDYRNKQVRLHRLITKCPKNMSVDHINHNPLDNRKSNLRICSHLQNMQNRKKSQRGASVYKGVCRCKRNNTWRAEIQCGYDRHYLGTFKTETEAARAYDQKAKELFKEFACLNFKEIP